MWLMVVLQVATVGAFGVTGDAFPDGDAVPDGDLLGADEDVLDEQSQDPLAFCDGGGGGVGAELGEEAFEVVGELEVGVAVGELGVEGVRSGRAGWSRGRAGRASGRAVRRW